jgi:hypothetical protein
MILSNGDSYKTEYEGDAQPIIQNLGPGVLYIGSTNDSLATKGLQLPVGAVYEYPARLVDGGGYVWLLASGDNCDVRLQNVG